jgi:hypothetical protein
MKQLLANQLGKADPHVACEYEREEASSMQCGTRHFACHALPVHHEK